MFSSHPLAKLLYVQLTTSWLMSRRCGKPCTELGLSDRFPIGIMIPCAPLSSVLQESWFSFFMSTSLCSWLHIGVSVTRILQSLNPRTSLKLVTWSVVKEKMASFLYCSFSFFFYFSPSFLPAFFLYHLWIRNNLLFFCHWNASYL